MEGESPATWTERVCLLDDEPLTGSESASVELSKLAQTVVRSFMRTPSSMIIHVDGTWGRGKTSFCKTVERALSTRDDATVSWYVASDETAPPWDAVLSAIARALTHGRDPEEVARIVAKWGSDGDPLGDPLQGLRDFLRRELGHASVSPTSDAVDMHVSAPMFHPRAPSSGELKDTDATRTVPRWEVRFAKPPSRMLVVIVDDIDRCRTDHVVAVFDAVRAFATCPGLKFIVAADRHLLEAASALIVERLGASDVRTADDALKKYIRHRVELPRFSDLQTELMSQTHALESMLLSGDERALLGGPRDLHGGVGFLLARVFERSLTMRELKRMLNALAGPLSLGADRAQLAPMEMPTYWADLAKVHKPLAQPLFFKSNPTRDNYAAFHLGTLLWISAQHLWPELVDGCEGNAAQVQERFNTLATVSLAIDFWDERRLDAALEHLFPHDPARPSSPKQVRRAYCDWVRRLYWSFKLHDFAPPPLEGAVEATLPTHDEVDQEPDATDADTTDLDDLWHYLEELEIDDRWLGALSVWLYEAGPRADIGRVDQLMQRAVAQLAERPERMSAEYATACASALDLRGLTRHAHDLLLVLAGSRQTPRWVGALPLLGDLARREPIDEEGLLTTLRCFQKYLTHYDEGWVDGEPRLARAYWRLRAHRPVAFADGDAAFEAFTRARLDSPAGAYAALACDALLSDDGVLRQVIHVAQRANRLERWITSLRVELADYLARRSEQAHWITARSLLTSIADSARSYYTLGVIEQRLSVDKATDRVARLFERSYRGGHRSEELKQAYASVLRARGDESRALLVENGEPLDEGDAHE